jgi:hypothetical protein
MTDATARLKKIAGLFILRCGNGVRHDARARRAGALRSEEDGGRRDFRRPTCTRS